MDDEQIQFEPEELIDKPFYYNIIIQNATIPDNYENIYVDYSVKIDDKKSETFKTKEVNLIILQIEGKTQNPVFDYKKLHHFEKITDTLLTYLQTAKVSY